MRNGGAPQQREQSTHHDRGGLFHAVAESLKQQATDSNSLTWLIGKLMTLMALLADREVLYRRETIPLHGQAEL